jgi:aryl sulfotransferase
MFDWSKHPYQRVNYRHHLTDTDRWDQFPHQPGDIFISTPPKNGTTWMQTIVTFLVFKSSELDFVPAERSPWFDMSLRPIEQALERLEMDEERNIIKTHTPMDGVPYFEDATYIGVFRDPRDAFFSFRNHKDNMTMDMGADAPVAEAFQSWLQADFVPGEQSYSLGEPVHHLKSLWDLQDRGNVHLFHYADMQRDLVAEMRRVADVIGVEIDEPTLSQLAEAAGFSNMKAKSEKFVPGGSEGFWKNPSDFLNKGKNGQYKGELSEEALAQFDARLVELAGEEKAAWLLNGHG